MVIAIKSIGVLFILVGILYLVKPEVFKHLMEFFKKGKRMYFAGLIRFVLAVVFLLGASDCYIKWVIAAFGILFLISGLFVFMLGPKKLGAVIDWFQRQPVLVLRLIAVIALAFGAIITYSA